MSFNKRRNIRFLFVGFIGVIINYMIFTPLREIFAFNIWIFHIDPAWFFGIVVSAELNYILNEFWTFKDKS